MGYTTYSTLNNLDEFSFIAGTTYYLEFKVYSDTGTAIDLTSGISFQWKAAPYGQKDYTVITKTNSSFQIQDDSYTAILTLNPSDTSGLSGKYAHQITVTQTISGSSTVFKPGQGTFTVLSNINN